MPLQISPIADTDISAVTHLWQRAGLTRPQNDPAKDIGFARNSNNADILIGRNGDKLVASVMVGHDGHRGVVYYLAVDPDRQGEGLGKQMMSAAESWLTAHGVWKLNLMIRADNHSVQAFYETLGYQPEDRIVMARRLDSDN